MATSANVDAVVNRLSNIASILAADVSVLTRSVSVSGAYKISNVEYCQPCVHKRQKLDVYIPKTIAFPRPLLPALLIVPGGAWVRGDKDYGTDSRSLAQRLYANVGYALASVGITTFICNYRLAPEHVYPAHVQDVLSAMTWVHTYAKQYGADPAALNVAGHSAGAHLLAMAGCSRPLPPIRSFIGLCGVYNLERLADAPLGAALITSAFGPRKMAAGGAEQESSLDSWEAASPVHALRASSPLVAQSTATGTAPSRPNILLVNAEEDAHLAQDAQEMESILRSLRSVGTRAADEAHRAATGPSSSSSTSAQGDKAAQPSAGTSATPSIQWHSPSPFSPGYDGVSRCTVGRSSHMSLVAGIGAPRGTHEAGEITTELMARFVAMHGTRTSKQQEVILRQLPPVSSLP